MALVEDIRAAFAGFEFGEACTPAEIRRAEEELGEDLPPVLRELYRAFDGFRGPTNAAFFWPLFATQSGGAGLVEMNRFFREGDPFPLDVVADTVFFGDNGIGAQWGLKASLPRQVIKWNASWGTEYKTVGDTPLTAWLAEKQFYDQLDADE